MIRISMIQNLTKVYFWIEVDFAQFINLKYEFKLVLILFINKIYVKKAKKKVWVEALNNRKK